MEPRELTSFDRLIAEIDIGIKILSDFSSAGRIPPAGASQGATLTAPAQRKSGRLMRVNHTGEIAAQALYRGQAFAAREPAVAAAMQAAAAEESDHLAWCEARLRALGAHTSRLNPIWYAGSFAIGTIAGLWGDRASLGFIAETEHQVEKHLDEHIARLPAEDAASRSVLLQMKNDEIKHGAHAKEMGATALPTPVKVLMRLTSQLMTRLAYWV
jgi:ubiquinone biosynthesis monooxygenase Coq7